MNTNTRFYARIETMVDGRLHTVPLFKGRKTFAFPSVKAAVKRAEKTGIAGRVLVYPAGINYADLRRPECVGLWQQVYCAAL